MKQLPIVLMLVAPSCFVAENATPAVGFGTTLATRFVHRGQTLVDNPVLQPTLAVGLPVKGDNGDRINLAVEGSMDLRNDTGGAWFPDGHAGRFTQIELVASYARKFGDVDVRAGIHNYNLPNGLEFRNGERGGTSEAFVFASTQLLETTPYVSINYDYDEVRAAYYRAGISEDIDIGPEWKVSLDGSLGYAASSQSAWMYGIAESGFADLRGEIVVKWQYDPRTQFDAGVHGSMIVDNTIDSWFRDLGIDDDPIWFTLGVSWSF